MFEVAQANGSYKLPNAMTVEELIAEGKSPAQAHKIMCDRVFGVNHPKDEDGNPVEIGLGSKFNPTRQHLEALKFSEALAAKYGNGPVNNAANMEAIINAVVAGVTAAAAAAKAEAAEVASL